MGESRGVAARDDEAWRRLLSESDVAIKHIHPALGPGWTAVLLEACCVRAAKQRALFSTGGTRERLTILRPLGVTKGGFQFLPQGRRKGDTMAVGASKGSVSMVEWLRKRACPWNERTCSEAAKAGHLDMLKYLHKNECPWNESTCSKAAKGGHLDVLKYAHENGCPFDADRCRRALRRFKQGRRGGGTGRKGRRE